MRIEIINKRNYPVNDKLKEVIERKSSRLDKYFSEDIPVKVFLKSEGNKCKMEIQLSIGKIFLTAEEVADNMYDAIDKVLPKIEKQIVKHKGRLADKVKLNPIKDESSHNEKSETIVKVKEFNLMPMPIEEAMYQMDLSGHEFYVFLDEDNTVKVLYRRFENGYGILVPKI